MRLHYLLVFCGQRLCLGLAAVLLAGCSFPSALQPVPGRAPVTIAAADLDHTTIGVYLYPTDDISGPAASTLVAAGARWTRSWFSWDDIEPLPTDPPTYQWQETDERLLAARRAGFETLFLLGGNAVWASDSFCGPIYPRHQADFQRFLRDLVQRYSQPPYDVRLWEIYNEPDSVFGPQGFCFGTRGAQYADSLRLAYTAIKAADPNAVVLFGGISYDFFTNEGGRFDPAFLDDALTAGAGAYFDRLAFHYYPAFAERWNTFGPGVAGKAAYLRGELARYGLDKPLALTEIGRPTRGPQADGIPYNEELTARFVAPALTRARIADLAPIIWFTAIDKADEPYDYGLFSVSLQAEPGLLAYMAVTPALQGGDYQGEVPVSAPGRAYRFRHKRQDAIIAWSDGEPVRLAVSADDVWLVDREAQAQWLRDGSTGDVDARQDGIISLTLDQNPVILWLRHAQEPAHE
ncbi:MAG: glycoside hydrolase family 5 protein [Chloroflexi bacterium]|nr:glycoside hydrolase family 5 protein [Chloroflexota bacterium]